MNKTRLFLFSLLLPLRIFCQSEDRAFNSISLHYGLHILARQEQLFSPMVYHAVTPVNFQLQYENENETRLHVATVIFNNYNARWHDEYTYLTGSDEVKEVETSPTLITLVQARYGYLKKIKKEEKMTWLIGGISDNQINAVENVYGGFSTFGYLGQFSIAPAAKAEFAINEKNTVAVTAWIPLLSWVARSPYALNDDEYMKNNADHNGLKTFFRYVGDGNIQFINHFQKLNLDAEYRYRISEHWLAGAGYQFEFLRNSEPKTLIAYQHYFNLNITYQF